MEAIFELEKPISFVNLAHDPEIEFEASTASFPPDLSCLSCVSWFTLLVSIFVQFLTIVPLGTQPIVVGRLRVP